MFETAAHACVMQKKMTHFRIQCSEITLHKAFASDKFGQILGHNGRSDQKMAQQNYDPETWGKNNKEFLCCLHPLFLFTAYFWHTGFGYCLNEVVHLL